jgi:hypothetical protein
MTQKVTAALSAIRRHYQFPILPKARNIDFTGSRLLAIRHISRYDC